MASSVLAVHGRHMPMEPRTALSLRAARRRTYLVKAIRLLCAGGMAIIVAAIAVVMVWQSFAPVAELAAETGEEESVRMMNPRFTGRDSAGAPYLIVAEAAVRTPGDPERPVLENPHFTFFDPVNPKSEVDADRGVYDSETGALELFGTVRFVTENGYRFETTHARVYAHEARIVGDEPVSGEGPMGAVQSQSFEILDGGDQVIFSGSVVGRIVQEPRPVPELRTDEDVEDE